MTRGQWTTTAAKTTVALQRGRHTKPSRIAHTLGVERSSLALALSRARYNLTALRSLTLTDLLALEMRPGDAERIFYLVQWERLQAHLDTTGELPDAAELTPLLRLLTPIFEHHFSRGAAGARLNETLLTCYRAVLEPDAAPTPDPVEQVSKRLSGRQLSFLQRFVLQLVPRLNPAGRFTTSSRSER